jgi:hypothetical protein
MVLYSNGFLASDHVSRNQLSYESDSDDDIVTHVVPTRHKISCKSHWTKLAEVFNPIGSTTSESILKMSDHDLIQQYKNLYTYL